MSNRNTTHIQAAEWLFDVSRKSRDIFTCVDDIWQKIRTIQKFLYFPKISLFEYYTYVGRPKPDIYTIQEAYTILQDLEELDQSIEGNKIDENAHEFIGFYKENKKKFQYIIHVLTMYLEEYSEGISHIQTLIKEFKEEI